MVDKVSHRWKRLDCSGQQTDAYKKHSNYACIYLYSFMTGIEYAVILPTIWQYLSEDFQANGFFMGLTISAFSFSGVIFGVIIGTLSDKHRHLTRQILLVTNTFEILGNILYFIASNKWLLLTSRFICGIGMSVTPVLIAYIALNTKERERTSILAYTMGFRQLGLMLGPVLNFFLHKFNFKLFYSIIINFKNAPGFFMFFMWILIQIVFFFCFYFDQQQQTQTEQQKKNEIERTVSNKSLSYFLCSFYLSSSSNISSNSDNLHTQQHKNTGKLSYKKVHKLEIFIIYSTAFIISFNQTALETLLTPFTENVFNWSDIENSALYSCAGIEILLSYLLVHVLVSYRVQDRCILLIGLLFIIIALCIGIVYLPLVFNLKSQHTYTYLPVFAVFVILDLIGLPFVITSSMSLCAKMSKTNSHGFTQGMRSGVSGVGTIVGPLFAGLFINKILYVLGFMLILVSFIFTVLIIYYEHFESKEEEATDQKNEIL